MFEEWSPEAEQAVHNHTATNNTYTIHADRISGYTYQTTHDEIDWGQAVTTMYCPSIKIKDINGTEERIASSGLYVNAQDNEIYLVNDRGEKIHLCGAETSEMKLQNLKNLVEKMETNDPVSRLVKNKIIEIFAEGGVQIEKI